MSVVPSNISNLIFTGMSSDGFAATYGGSPVNNKKLITVDGKPVEVTDGNWIEIYNYLLARKRDQLGRDLTNDEKQTQLEIVNAKKNQPSIDNGKPLLQTYDPAVRVQLDDIKQNQEGVRNVIANASLPDFIKEPVLAVGDAAGDLWKKVSNLDLHLPDLGRAATVVEVVAIAAGIYFLYKIVK